ncbi:MAG: two-component regulator propeller domain-containing protein [Myxococcota bacterium]
MRTQSLLTVALLALTLSACGGKTSGTTGSGDPLPGGDSINTGGGSFTATIVRPNGSLSILSGDTITLEAEFLRAGLRVIPTTVSWDAASLFLGNTNPLANQTLTDGTHVITVKATLDGRVATDSVTVTVSDFAVRIIDPDNGDVEDTDANIRFIGEAILLESAIQVKLLSGAATAPDRTATYAWSSSIDGAFGTSSDDFRYDLLSVGLHTVSLTVTDDDATNGTGRSATASIELDVLLPNTRPTATITSPATCPAEVEVGGTLSFTGTITDPDPNDTALVGTWLDSVTGDTADANTYTFSAGSTLGFHEITFTATDTLGDSDTDSCGVWVVAVGGSAADFFPDTSAINNNLPGNDNNINWIGVDGDGNTWIANDRGIGIYDSSMNEINVYTTTNFFTGGIGGNNKVLDVAFAGSGAFVATENGLVLCAYASGSLTTPCTELDSNQFDGVAASGDPASSGFVAAAADGGLYLASLSGGSVDSEDFFDDGNSNLPDNRVRDVIFVGGTLYVGTDNGMCIIDDPGGVLDGSVSPNDMCSSIIDGDNSPLPDDEVRSFAAAGTTLWIGTSSGVAKYDTTAGNIVEIFDKDSGMANDKINDIAIDGSGILWVGTDDGLARIDPATGNITNIRGQNWVPPVAGDRVNSVFIDAAGVKWLGTDNGIVAYNGT